MKVFHCDHCENLVFFENTRCEACGHTLAYLPDRGVTGSLDEAEGGLLRCPLGGAGSRTYRLCRNYTEHAVCNWAIPAADENPLCRSCRLTRVIPDLSSPANKAAWYKLENAKRRLLYTLLALKLPVVSKQEQPHNGLAFEMLADPPGGAGPKVLTGHQDGLITLSIAEADDAERERRRNQMHEPYRTLLGHFRHEIGHYYWDLLIKDSDLLGGFRKRFGDERADYDAALARHYKEGTPADWQEHFISAYAAVHPWEDWAETWAHYLHMTDTLETAVDCGLALKPKRSSEPALKPDPNILATRRGVFDAMMNSWHALTYVLNNLNRGMGLHDAYPFVLMTPAIEKLRFVHDVVVAQVQDAKK